MTKRPCHIVLIGLSIALFTTLTIVLTVALVTPPHTFAAPNRQDNPPPYTLTQVGGQPSIVTLPAFELNGFAISETTVESQYPAGMTFTMTASSANGPITDATLFIEIPNSTGSRVEAHYDNDTKTWTAHLWEAGGEPAWQYFKAWWSVVDATNASIEGDSAYLDYADPAHVWWRVETDAFVLYWIDGAFAGEPEPLAAQVAQVMAVNEQQLVEGFGGRLSYKPMAIIYADDQDLEAMSANVEISPIMWGYNSAHLSVTVLTSQNPDPAWFDDQAGCPYLVPLENRTLEWRTDRLIHFAVPSLNTFLYQYDKKATDAPRWWRRGQAIYFGGSNEHYDARLSQLATLQDLPTLEGDNFSASNVEADGCVGLSYDVGASFVNWFISNYGGLPTHASLMERLDSNETFYEAMEAVTGKTFLALENEWRTAIGFNILSGDTDPASALGDPIDSPFAVGDTVTLPATPMQVPLAGAPGPNQIGKATCFGGTDVTILQAGSLDGVNYYEIDCASMVGWVTLSQLKGQ